jgi:Na+(H+)/acetate symporter ActP
VAPADAGRGGADSLLDGGAMNTKGKPFLCFVIGWVIGFVVVQIIVALLR